MRCFVAIFCWVLGSGFASAQPAAQGSSKAASSQVPSVPQVPPLAESRIDYFRKLLAMSPEEREKSLADKPESQRNILRTKIQEYSALAPEEAEARLRALQLHWYLSTLMRLAPPARAATLDRIPEEDRTLIVAKLERWDALPAELRQDVLDNEFAMQYFVRFESGSPAQQELISNRLPPQHRKTVEDQLAKWHSLPQEHRQKMYQHFNQFFELPDQEKDKTLNELSEEERQKMEASLKAFDRLPPEQRKMCIDAFRKFANMSSAERDQFFQNVERWKEMTPRERETWRNLVTLLPPTRQIAMPPNPPGSKIGAVSGGILRGTNVAPPPFPGPGNR